MGDNVLLIGSEEVARAGHNMTHAAQEMKQAAYNIEASLHMHQQFMTQWLQDLERVLTDNKP